MTEQAGRLSERVRFERRLSVRGTAAQLSDAWEFVFARWAEVTPVARADPLPAAADTRHLARRWRIVIRNGETPEVGMRIRWRSEMLMLSAVEFDPASPDWLTLWAEDFGSISR